MAPSDSSPYLVNPLFVPGNRPDMLEKASGIEADALFPDLEDAVPPDEKSEARDTVERMLPALAAGGAPVIPRVNAVSTGLAEEDVRAVMGPHISAISIGKVDTAADVLEFEAVMVAAESAAGLPAGSVGILPWIETARAVIAAFEICSATPRVRWVAFGADDLTRDLGVPRPHEADPGESTGSVEEPVLAYPRAAIALAARAAGVQALDTPYVAFRDHVGLRAEAARARRLGFTGKFAIHPAQVPVIAEAFAPDAAEIAQARRVLKAWEEAAAEGRGVISVDGRMVDAPVVERARALLHHADHGSSR